eukprot:XP_001696030.1 predicted protein [Chlamydomonas reinhardtii]
MPQAGRWRLLGMRCCHQRQLPPLAPRPFVPQPAPADCVRAVRSWCKMGYGDPLVVHVPGVSYDAGLAAFAWCSRRRATSGSRHAPCPRPAAAAAAAAGTPLLPDVFRMTHNDSLPAVARLQRRQLVDVVFLDLALDSALRTAIEAHIADIKKVVSRGGDRPVVAGRLRLVPRLEAVQHEVMAEPTVLLVEGLTGAEEIPEGCVAVLVGSAAEGGGSSVPDVLSHSAVRARNMGVLLAGCHCAQTVARISEAAGSRVMLRLEGADVQVSFSSGSRSGASSASSSRSSSRQ